MWCSSPACVAEQERPHERLLRAVAKAADDAVGRAHALELLHAGALSGPVREVAPLRHDAVETAAERMKPVLGFAALARMRRETHQRICVHVALGESLQRLAPFFERPLDERFAFFVDQEIEHDEKSGMLARELLDPAFAGWIRMRSSSNESPLPSGITSSPSSTKRRAGSFLRALPRLPGNND